MIKIARELADRSTIASCFHAIKMTGSSQPAGCVPMMDDFMPEKESCQSDLREQEILNGYDEIAQAERSGELTYDDLTNGDGLDLEDAATWKS
jgi:hypothetical protein